MKRAAGRPRDLEGPRLRGGAIMEDFDRDGDLDTRSEDVPSALFTK